MSPQSANPTATDARDSRLATRDSLEATLHEVHATLSALLVAADEQYAAVAAHQRDRIERVTRQQEQLSGRLRRAERTRLEILKGLPLSDGIAGLPEAEASRVEALRTAIAGLVEQLQKQQTRTSRLLARRIELGKQTLDFVQSLVMPRAAYDPRGYAAPRRSVLLDGHA
jgi:flagellar biosynthesis/type III secretory pathway chaperone